MAADTTPGSASLAVWKHAHTGQSRLPVWREIVSLISNSDVYVGEMDLEQQPEVMITHHYNLKNHLSASAYAKMRKHFLKSIKIDIERFVHVHPLLASARFLKAC
jgi:hypothetical protein